MPCRELYASAAGVASQPEAPVCGLREASWRKGQAWPHPCLRMRRIACVWDGDAGSSFAAPRENGGVARRLAFECSRRDTPDCLRECLASNRPAGVLGPRRRHDQRRSEPRTVAAVMVVDDVAGGDSSSWVVSAVSLGPSRGLGCCPDNIVSADCVACTVCQHNTRGQSRRGVGSARAAGV